MANRFKKAAESRGSRVEAPTEVVESIPEPRIVENIKQTPATRDDSSPTEMASDRSKTRSKKSVEQVGISLKVPKKMHEAMKYHYASTGEKMTAYIIRLVEEDMGMKF